PRPAKEKEEVDTSNLPPDPANRIAIFQYSAKVRDDVRRAYLLRGPFQPTGHAFLQTDFSGVQRRFNEEWFKDHKSWLEYSTKENAAFCLCCYLFQNESLGHGGGDVFSTKGWKSWNNVKRLDIHVGGPSSTHNQNMKRCDDLMNQKQSIGAVLHKGTKKSNIDDVAAVALKNAPQNLKLVSSTIQKHIVKACAIETVKAIIEDLGDEYFAILVDESRDEKQAKRVQTALQNGELETGRGLNQELGLKRAGDTRWGSHFSSLLNMIVMFPSVIEVVDDNAQNASKALDRIKAKGVLDAIQTFDFVLMMHLMKADIVNAVSYLHTTKRRLQEMRNQGWEGMIKKRLLIFALNKILNFLIWMLCIFPEDRNQSVRFRLMAYQIRITTKV
uniref:TTF-type domain-containing protein n=1 Tax=Aegilops tauschii subsp. strangulata TaxID=200361 RepID=A0A453IU79_AEGTS